MQLQDPTTNTTTNPLLEAALDYQKRGWSVIPLKPGDKPPLLASWKMYQARVPSPEEVKVWWTRWPDANIGIVTGKVSKLVVVDSDGPDGASSLKSLGAIPVTPVVQTGKGWHYYHAYPPGGDPQKNPISNFAGKLPGLDFRGDGGYVVAPPSLHPSGAVYEWAIEPEDTELAPISEGIQKLIDGSGGQVKGAGKGKEGTAGKAGEQAEKSIDWVLEAMNNGCGQGDRNSMAARLAGHYLGIGMVPSDVEAVLRNWNAKNKPPLDDSELATVIASVARSDAEKKQRRRSFEVAKIEKILTSPPIYQVHVFDCIVVMSIDDLTTFARFKKVVAEVSNHVPRVKKISDWDEYLEELFVNKLAEIEAPPEASPEAILWDTICGYLTRAAKNDPNVLLGEQKNGVYLGQLYYYVLSSGLLLYLQRRQIRERPADIWNVMRKHGCRSEGKKIKDEKGKVHSVRCWWIPIGSVLPDLPLEDGENDLSDDLQDDLETVQKNGNSENEVNENKSHLEAKRERF